MSKVLCTFSGPYGDILWSLPTVRAISQMVGERVDMATMPEYKSLQGLLQHQPYIDMAYIMPAWKCTGSPHGNQPWNPPAHAVKGYERVFNLTYQAHPGIGGKRLPLIDFIADQQGIKLINPLPFITTRWEKPGRNAFVALAFNNLYADLKLRFMEVLRTAKLDITIQDVSGMNWLDAASVIKQAICFVGCRSSNNVLAHGVNQKNIFIYEPHPSRKASGQFGDVFGCPYGTEISSDAEPEVCAANCIGWIEKWKAEKEKQNETLETVSG